MSLHLKLALALLLLTMLAFAGILFGAQQTATIQLSIQVGHYAALDWTAAVPGTDPVVGYNVYRGPGSSGPWTKLTPSPINQLDYNDSAIQLGQTYFYYVTAVDSSGVESSPSNIVSGTVPQS